MVPYLRVANVLDGCIDYSDVYRMHFTHADEKKYSLRKGDILLNEGQSTELVGRSAIFDGQEGEFCYQNSLVNFRCGPSVVPQFARAVFKRWLDIGHFTTIVKQTTSMAHLGGGRFARLDFPVPPLPEQRRIAEILDAVGDAIRKTEQLIAKLKQLKHGLLHDLFTRGIDENGALRDPVGRADQFRDSPWGSVPRSWSVGTLADHTEDIRYGTSAPSEAGVGSVPVLRIPNVQYGRIDLEDLKFQNPSSADLDRFGVQPGDLLVIRTNGNPHLLGRCAEVPREFRDRPCLFASYLIRVRLARARTIPSFVALLLHSRPARGYIESRAATSAGNYNINTLQLRAMPVCLPSLNEQERIVASMHALERRLEFEAEEADKLRALKNGLTEDLLTGRVRVTNLPKEDAA